jgi:cytochrome c peroxidase
VAARVELGRRLFYDADLSANGTMACATCHEQRHAFADGNATHPGVTDEPGLRNVPGLANVGRFARLTMADPAMTTLERQVETPLFGTHPVEMGMKGRAGEFARRLGGQACYKAMFARAFPAQQGRIDTGTVALALAAFERTITATRAPVDQGPLPPAAKAGKALFARHCAACHTGPDFTDFAYHRIDLTPDQAERGLMDATGREADRGALRTPRCAMSPLPALVARWQRAEPCKRDCPPPPWSRARRHRAADRLSGRNDRSDADDPRRSGHARHGLWAAAMTNPHAPMKIT